MSQKWKKFLPFCLKTVKRNNGRNKLYFNNFFHSLKDKIKEDIYGTLSKTDN